MSHKAKRMTQLPLSLQIPDKAAIKEFFVSEANRLAYEWLEKWPDWPAPYQALNIYGPKGCGKSHLGEIFSHKLTCATLSSLPEFDRDQFANCEGFVLEDVQPSDKWDQESLFHLINYLAETRQSALITSQIPVSQMPWSLADLSSRFRALPSQAVQMPDDDLLEALLDSYFTKRQCQVSEPAMRYILTRIERSYEAIGDIAQAVDEISLAQKRPVTTALVRDLFQD